MRGEIRLQEEVDGIGVFGTGGNFRAARLEIVRFEPAEGDVGVPFRALVNPRAEQADLFRA